MFGISSWRVVGTNCIEPTGEVLVALFGAGVGACVGPFAQRGLDEAFGFAVGSRGIER